MGIKLNGVEITSNKLNNSDVTLEKLDGVKVWPTAVKTKQWVYLYYTTSRGGYSPFYEITSSSEQPTAELMEQKFPASNYNVGHLGEIQWWDDFYVFQVQEV
jgi:hypothetical protein